MTSIASLISTDPSSLPQKRKSPPAAADARARSVQSSDDADGQSDSSSSGSDADTIKCDKCNALVPTRDRRGAFTTEPWDQHKSVCHRPVALQEAKPEPCDGGPQEFQFDSAQPPAKRRRAKRTEDERIEYLRSDPYIAEFEPYRVLCGSCDKWIRLRPNSTYCSIPWDAHRKSCLAKKGKNGGIAPQSAAGDRAHLLGKDPNVKKFDRERVLCRGCDQWVPLCADDDEPTAMKAWAQHRSKCQEGGAARGAPPAKCHIPDVPPPSKHLLALASSSSLPPPPPLTGSSHPSIRPQAARSASAISTPTPNPRSPPAYQDHASPRHPPSHDSRGEHDASAQRRSKNPKNRTLAQQKDSDVARWVNEGISNDVPMPDVKNARYSTRDDRYSSTITRTGPPSPSTSLHHFRHEGAAGSGDEEQRGPRGWDRMDVDMSPPRRLADLDGLPGRLEFVSRSIRHLFRISYSHSDDLTIAALVTYLNAALPPDKHEEFDTAEVTKAAISLRERGKVTFEGDVLRLPN